MVPRLTKEASLEMEQQPNKPLSDQEVWAEVGDVAEELYDVYLELNELDMPTTIQSASPRLLDVDRNWDVPIGIDVSGYSHSA